MRRYIEPVQNHTLLHQTSPSTSPKRLPLKMFPSSMSSTMKTATALLLPLAYAAPAFPPPAELTQGIVNSNISSIAGGPLPNNTAAVATGMAITGLQLLASLENIEAFFYSDAIQNLTSGIYTTGDLPLNDTLEIIEKIAAVSSLPNPPDHPIQPANTTPYSARSHPRRHRRRSPSRKLRPRRPPLHLHLPLHNLHLLPLHRQPHHLHKLRQRHRSTDPTRRQRPRPRPRHQRHPRRRNPPRRLPPHPPRCGAQSRAF